ncbi:DoxX family protein [Polyangium sorediatum]|uniref:DoxX family protein n=1 Tax=Polyangium sorediatum TaxID=889274 RepID=A0ABT6NJZ6_9BACT|nr:DoxX family protein [Polyangium sorediatum]MDI1428631.1 DoxX family protein [Polyangium sorediatum]
MNDKARTIAYWVATGLLGFAFAAGGLGDLSRSPQVMEGMTHLGYPPYFATILGAWKVLGAVALLVPRFPRLKEWAYAGIIFDLTGAAASHAASGDPAGKVITPLVLVAIAAASWALRPASRKLPSEPKRETEARIAKPALAT